MGVWGYPGSRATRLDVKGLDQSSYVIKHTLFVIWYGICYIPSHYILSVIIVYTNPIVIANMMLRSLACIKYYGYSRNLGPQRW